MQCISCFGVGLAMYRFGNVQLCLCRSFGNIGYTCVPAQFGNIGYDCVSQFGNIGYTCVSLQSQFWQYGLHLYFSHSLAII